MNLDDVTLSYECQETDDPNINDQEQITMQVFFANASRVTPSKLEIIPSSKNSIPNTNITFSYNDFNNLDSFYSALISKARGTPSNKHFLVFVKHEEWNGFICSSAHVHFLSHFPDDLLIVNLCDTFIDRIIKCFGKSTITEELQTVITGNANSTTNAVGTVINSFGRSEEEETTKILTASSRGFVDNHARAPIPKSNLVVEEQDDICLIPVWRQYKPLFMALNSICYAIDEHLSPRERTRELSQETVRTIVTQIIEAHAIEE